MRPERGGDRPGVLLVGSFLSGSGRARAVCEDLAERLEGAGWRVVTASRRSGRAARLLDVLWTVWSRRGDYRVAQIDLFSGPAFVWGEAAARLLRRVGRPYCLTLHGGNLPAFARRHAGRVRSVLARAAAVTSPSAFLARELAPYRADIDLLPNPLDLGVYPYFPRRALRPRLVWLRSFHAIYNPEMAPRVVARLAEEFPDVRLRMVGPDKGDGSFARTRAEAERLRVADRIEFFGPARKADVPSLLSDADVFVNTSRVDNAPVSVVEAMACGLCVVSTDVGGLRDLARDGVDALLVPSDDAAAMAGAVRRLLVDPALAASLSAAARRRVEETGWDLLLPRWEALLQGIDRQEAGRSA